MKAIMKKKIAIGTIIAIAVPVRQPPAAIPAPPAIPLATWFPILLWDFCCLGLSTLTFTVTFEEGLACFLVS